MKTKNEGADLTTAKGTKLKIDGKVYNWYEQYITGAEIKKLANIHLDSQLWVAITKPREDVKIEDDEKIDLARPGIEHFFSKPADTTVKIKINKDDFRVEPGVYTVVELKNIGGVALGHDLEQVIDGKLTPLKDGASVEIKGGERFISHVKDGSSS